MIDELIGQPAYDAQLERFEGASATLGSWRGKRLAVFCFSTWALGRGQLPLWLKVAAAAGMASSLVALLISVYPVVDVVSRAAFAGKICAVVVVSNMAGVLIYRIGQRNTLE